MLEGSAGDVDAGLTSQAPHTGIAITTGITLGPGVALAPGITLLTGIALAPGITVTSGITVPTGITLGSGIALASGITLLTGIAFEPSLQRRLILGSLPLGGQNGLTCGILGRETREATRRPSVGHGLRDRSSVDDVLQNTGATSAGLTRRVARRNAIAAGRAVIVLGDQVDASRALIRRDQELAVPLVRGRYCHGTPFGLKVYGPAPSIARARSPTARGPGSVESVAGTYPARG